MPDAIIGGSPALRRILAAIPRLASESGPVIITGETGVGKSLVAAHIHSRSPRSAFALEVVNFSLLSERDQRVAILGGGPPELTTTRRSVLELPTTVLLKHVDHASPFIQQTLAWILTSGEILRPGSRDSRRLTARIIFTSRNSIPSLFRGRAVDPPFSDILRSSRSLHIPPLRKRTEDISILAAHILEKFPTPLPPSFSSGLRRILLNHTWPGNVTELKAYLRTLILPTPSDALLERERIELSKILLSIDEEREISLRDSLANIESLLIE